ncbi:hypothetical protein ACFLWW_04100 [Chloroflexota bacterium]
MTQDKVDSTQSSPVLTPTVEASYRNGWRQMKKYFLELLLIFIIGAVISGPSGGSRWSMDDTTVVTAGMVILSIFLFAYNILIASPVEYGISFANLKAVRNDKLEIKDIFGAFQNYWNAVLANLLVGVIVVVGIFLLIVPGIIFACKLAFTPYLVVDRKMDVIEAVKESWRMTNGHAWTVFLIGLLAIPICIVGLICFVVGIIPAIMWIKASFASLYHAVNVLSEGHQDVKQRS